MGGVRRLLLLLAVCGICLSWVLPPPVSADDGDAATEVEPAADDGTVPSVASTEPAVPGVPLANGWFFPSTADGTSGVAILDEPNGPPFWSSYQQLGGTAALGSPVSRPFLLPDGRVYQAMQFALLVWRPGSALAERADVLDMMAAAGLDDWLSAQGIPRAERTATALDRLGWLDEPSIRAAYFGEAPAAGTMQPLPATLARFGLPASHPQPFDGFVTQRFQRAVLRVSLAAGADEQAAEVSVLAVGELLRASGLLAGALAPEYLVGGTLVARAPRPQLAWPSDTGWGIPAPSANSGAGAVAGVGDGNRPAPTAAAGASAAPSASVPTVTPATAPVTTVIPAAPTLPAVRPPAPTTSARSADAPAPRPPVPLQPGVTLVIRDVVNQGRAEYVVIANTGTVAQELTGWTLRSGTGGQTYDFPAGFVLAAGASVNVHSGAGDAATFNRPPTDLYVTSRNIWNNSGDDALLVDPTGRVIAEKRYGTP